MNGTFDQGTAESASGWVFEPATGEATGHRRPDGGVDGSACLEVTVTTPGQCDFRPATGAVPLQPGAAYLLTVAIKASTVAAEGHAAELQWFGPNGYISRDRAAAGVKDRWVTVAAGPATPPEGATSVHILLRCYAVGTYTFDAVHLEACPAAGPGRNVLGNGGFESDADGDGVPDHWLPTPTAAAGTLLGWDAAVRHAGAHSVFVRRTGEPAESAAAWVQDGIPVTPALRYELAADTHADAFGRNFRLAIEWQQGGQTVSVSELVDQTTEGWQHKTLEAVAPAAAEQARVTLEARGAGTVWFDSVALLEQRLVARVDLWFEAPSARGLLRDGVDPRALRVGFALETSEPGARLRLALVDAAETRRAEFQPTTPQGTWGPDTAGFPRGAYRIVAEATAADGRVLVSETAPLDIVAPDTPGIVFRADHVALVDGQPWFPIGVCSMPVMEPVAERLAAAGFNLIVAGSFTDQAPETVRATLDRAHALGLRLIEWNNGWAYEDLKTADRDQRFRTSVGKVAGHPAFLGWMCDEAIWNGVPLGRVRASCLAARAAAPTLVFWQNQAPRNRIEDLARYVRWADVTGMDIYPVEGSDHSDLPNKTLSVVGDEMDKQHRTTLPPTVLAAEPNAPGRKPVWAILQGFGWLAWDKDPQQHKRAPTWDETRFMAYDAILHGAVGIVYWGASYEAQDTPIWDHLRRIARELADATPALVAAERADVKVEGAPGVIAQGRRVDGKLWVLAANETAQPATVRLRVAGAAVAFERVAESAALTVADGVVSDSFAPYAVHVYRQR